jgi:uncharacterized protein (TIGR04255 family)
MVLPSKLGIEPLLEAVVEIRFTTTLPASTLLPGMLFSSLSGQKSIERLPQAEIPAPIRHGNPDLKYSPLFRVNWDRFLIAVGDYSLSVSCKLPYPGWGAFKAVTLEVLNVFTSAGFAQSIERCSYKSTDVIEKKHGSPKDVMRLVLDVGAIDLTEKPFHIRSEVRDEKVLHIVQVASDAAVTLTDGTERMGMLIDTDTICDLHHMGIDEFKLKISDYLQLVHDKNKEMFFSYLKEEFLKKLEPVYG